MTLTTAPTHDHVLPPLLRAFAPYGILALIIFAVYGNIFDNGFLFDDDLLIQLDSNLRGWGHIGDILRGSTTSGAYIVGGFYRPVQILLYLVVFQLGHGSTIGFHLLNLFLHVGNACLLYRLGTKIGFKAWGVFLAALVWALHPLHTEAVTYMSATADPLFVFFSLWAIVSLVPAITQRQIFKIIPLFLLGLLSKETMVMFPLLVMTCLFLTNERRLDARTYVRTWPLWLIALVFVYWRMHAQGLDGPQTYARLYQMPAFATLKMYADHPLYRIYTFWATLPQYLGLIVWPTGLHMERSFSIFTTLLSAPVLAGLVIFLVATVIIGLGGYEAHKGDKLGLPMSWGLLWFGAAHAPDSGILIPMNSLFLEHWMYLPSIGLFLGIAETAAQLLAWGRRTYTVAASVAVIGIAAAMAGVTYAQNMVWHDPVSFYSHIFAYGEQSARGHNNLALYYSNKHEYVDAVDQFKQAIAISDSYAETRHNLALTYLRMPDQRAHIQDAIDNLNRALEIDPNFYRSSQTLGDVYDMLGDKAKSEIYLDRARASVPH